MTPTRIRLLTVGASLAALLATLLVSAPATARRRDHRVIPSGDYLLETSRAIYIVDRKLIRRLDKRRDRLRVFRRGTRRVNLARIVDDKTLALQWVGSKRLQLVALARGGKRGVAALPASMRVSRWAVSSDGASATAVNYRGARGGQFRVELGYVPIAKTAGTPRRASVPDAVYLHGATLTGAHVAYGVLAADRQGRDHPMMRPFFREARLWDGRTGQSKTLLRFATVSGRNRLAGFRAGPVFGVAANTAGGTSTVLLRYDTRSGKLARVRAGALRWFGSRGRISPCRFDRDGSAFLCVASSAKGRALVTIGLDGKRARKLALPASGKVYAYGPLPAKRGGYWAHVGDRVYFSTKARPGKTSSLGLVRLARKRRPEWSGGTTFTSGPDALYVGIERGGWRYFMRVRWKRFQRAAK